MKPNRKLVVIIGLILMVGACIPPDEKVTPVPRIAGFNSVDMGSTYEHQIFFDLGKNEVVKTIPKTEWDIGINYDSKSILTNTGRFMHVALSSINDITGIVDTIGHHFEYDSANGYEEDRALADYTLGDPFIINLGYDIDGSSLGFIAADIIISDENEVNIRWKYLNSPDVQTTTFSLTQNDANFTYFSFLTNEVVTPEPPKETYDLIFRQYIFYFNEEKLPYYVTGPLLNWSNTVAYALTSKDPTFDEFTGEDVDESRFTNKQDVIGYDWKYYDFDAGVYVTDTEQVFIIKDVDGFLYKLRFTGFYSELGVKGTPNFELAQL